MRTHQYPSDVTDAKWALIEPHLPVHPGGRPRKTDLRDVVDAIFTILRTGCQWRYLPMDFPPKSHVWWYFQCVAARRNLRQDPWPASSLGPNGGEALPSRTSARVDSQSVDTISGGEERGRDNAKNIDGRKRHIVVDSIGFAAAKGAAELFLRLDGQPMGKDVTMYGDSKDHNFKLYQWVEEHARWKLTIVRRPEGSEGWVKLPIRWTVERTFAWLGRCRRLSLDREKSILSSELFMKLPMIRLMLSRIEPPSEDAEFHYREAV